MMFSQLNLIIGAVVLTILVGLGITIYIQHNEIAAKTEQLGAEQTKNAVQDETIKQLQANALEVKKLFEDNNNRLQQAAQQAQEVNKLLILTNTSDASKNPTQVQTQINTNLTKLFKQLQLETDPSQLQVTSSKGKTK
jgi:hypothetical protein